MVTFFTVFYPPIYVHQYLFVFHVLRPSSLFPRSHKRAEVTMATFYLIKSEASPLPSTLSALEEQNFLFQLQLQDNGEKDSSVVR